MDVRGIVETQSDIARLLKNSLAQNRLSHAYLFYGDKGVGKKEIAYYLACLLYCKNDGCLECNDCESILNNNHMNVHYIGILENKKLISKSQIEDLQEEFAKTSLVDGPRIYIVDGIDTASSQAQNSLLKFIEEPINKEETYGIFIAQNINAVVSTIQSRCAMIHFCSLSKEYIKDSLLKKGYTDNLLYLIPFLTNNPNDANDLMNDENLKKVYSAFLEFIDVNGQSQSILFYLKWQKLFSDSNNISMLLKWILAFYDDLINSYTNRELILEPFIDNINRYKQDKDYNRIKYEYLCVLELDGRVSSNVISRNIFHQLIVICFNGGII